MKKLVALLILLGLTQSVQAEKMDLSTTSDVITKLERVLSITEENDSKAQIALRLADLYSERARFSDANSQNNQGTPDRLKALALYETYFKNLDSQQKAIAILQMAQLYELTGQNQKAKALFESILRNSNQFPSEVVGHAFIGLGEFKFVAGEYKAARDFYKKALQVKSAPRKWFVTYRLAWCGFHLGEVNKATHGLATLLKENLEPSFAEEVSRDLATFYSRGQVGNKEIQTLAQMSPERTRGDNLQYLAKELDRLGKKKSALQVIAFIGATNPVKNSDSSEDQIESHVQKAEIQYDIGNKKELKNEYTTAVSLWKDKGCDQKDQCENLRTRLKNIATKWDKAEKLSSPPSLLEVYALYTSIFDDVEMNYWAAQLARRGQFNQKASEFYRAAAESCSRNSSQSECGKLFEGSLLGYIEVAELSQNAALQDQAYDFYLAKNPKGAKASEVRYQKVYLKYKRADYAQAADDFHNLALESKFDRGLAEKAADLSLDSLVLAHRETEIEIWALQYSQTFKHRQKDFLNISRKAIVNAVARVVKDQISEKYEWAYSKLLSINLKHASQEEAKNIVKYKLVLAEKLRSLESVKISARQLLKLKLTAEEKELALSRLAWAHELQLEFKEAFKITKKLELKELSQKERLLKLALLADLAGQNPDPYYIEYLNYETSGSQKAIIVARLVRHSKNPESVFRRYQSLLQINPELYGQLAVEVFAKNRSDSFASEMNRKRWVQRTKAGLVLSRFAFVKGVREYQQTHRIKRLPKNVEQLRTALKERLRHLKQIDSFVLRSAEIGDWTSQIVALNIAESDYKRLSEEIKSLPVPLKLNRSQREQYRTLLERQAQPFTQKAQQISAKLDQLWGQSDYLDALEADFKKSKGSMRRLLSQELNWLYKAAPQDVKSSIAQILRLPEDKPESRHLIAARASVKHDPFNASTLENLKSLEERSGKTQVVAYLDARISKLQAGGRP